MLIRTDDTDAFGQDELLRINFTVPEGQTVTKAVLICGELKLIFNSPVSPLKINLTSAQTAVLRDNNCCDLELYDGNNKKTTIPCIAEFKTRESANKK